MPSKASKVKKAAHKAAQVKRDNYVSALSEMVSAVPDAAQRYMDSENMIINSEQERQVIGVDGHAVTAKRHAKHASSGQSEKTKAATLTGACGIGRHVTIMDIVTLPDGTAVVTPSTRRLPTSELGGRHGKVPLPAKYRGKLTSQAKFRQLGG